MAGAPPPRKRKPAPDAAAVLRSQAEARLDELGAGAVASPPAPAPEELAVTVHELRVHQVELEMQNEELRRAQIELDAQREKYLELFDLAPVGYLTLSDEGIVRDANSTAAQLLRTRRRRLINKPFSALVCASDQDAYYLYSRLLEKTGAPQSCELRLQRPGAADASGAGAPTGSFWARLESRPRGVADGETLYWTAFIDVSARKQAEETLSRGTDEVARQQELLATLLDTIPSPVFYKDAGGAYLGCNLAFERLMGLERGEIVGKTAADLGPSEIVERYDEMDLRLLARPGTQTYECQVAAADGTHDMVFNKATFSDSGGQVAGLIGVLLDITAHKRSEEALKESELNLRAVFDTVDDIVVVSTPEGRLVYANPAASARLGYGAAEIVGMQMLDLYPAEERAAAGAIFAGMSWGGREVLPLPLQSKSGAPIPVETRAWVGRWEGAERIFGVSRDLIREQEALRKFDWLFRRNPALTAVGTLPEGRLTEVNDAFLSTLGYSRAEVLGHTPDELDLFVDPAEPRAMAEQLQAQGRFSDRELQVSCKDGTILDGLVSAEIIESQGQQYFLTVMIDQTERKQAEEGQRRSERQLQSALDGLAASIVVLDEQGTILLVNRSWREFAEQNGPAPGSVSEGANYLQVCDAAVGEDAAEAASFAAGIRAVLSGEADSYLIEYPCDAPGEKRWFSGRVTVFPSEGPPRVVVAHEDITLRRQAEHELRETRDYLESLFGYANAPIVVWDPEQRITRFNHAFEDLTGRLAEEVVGKHLELLFPGDERRAHALELVSRATVGERWEAVEIPIVRADGEVRTVLWNSATVYAGDAATPLATIAQGQDITVRKAAEGALQESETNFRAFFDTADDIIVVAGPDGRLVYANPAASARLGFSVAELIAMHVLGLRRAEQRAEAEALFAALLRGEGESCPLPLQCRSGALLPVETRVRFGHWDGLECTFHVSKDRTREQEATLYAQVQAELNERRQTEEALVLSARELHEQLLDTVKTMGAIVGLRDPYTAAHERSVTMLAMAIALEMGLDEMAREGLAFAGEVHDIGKVAVPAEILSKPAALNEDEFALIKRHAQAGRELLGAIRFRQPVAEIVGQHQERLDGSGYPDGLKGDEIMLEARILAVADVVEAMASHRPYRPALGLEAALAEVRAGAGVRYDADAVAACERVFAAGFVFSES